MTICKGAVVRFPTKIEGTVVAVDYNLKTVVIQKENGGTCACPINAVTVVSYKEVK